MPASKHAGPKLNSPLEEDEYLLMRKLLGTTTNASQRELARALGFSLGKVNYCIKALIEKGLIKAERFSKNPHKSQYVYLLTPKGLKSKAKLAAHFLERKVAQYEALKAEIEGLREALGDQGE